MKFTKSLHRAQAARKKTRRASALSLGIFSVLALLIAIVSVGAFVGAIVGTSLLAGVAKVGFDLSQLQAGAVLLANEKGQLTTIGERFDPGKHQAGIYLANEDLLAQTHFQEGITDYLVGWNESQDIDATIDAIAPPVQVGRRFEFHKSDDSEAFLSEDDDIRAINAEFKRVDYKGDVETSRTLNKGLTERIDKDRISGNTTVDQMAERSSTRLLSRLSRNEARRCMTTLLSLDSGTAKTWGSTQDPDGDMHSLLESAADEAGIYPNTVKIGSSAWSKRFLGYRAQDNAGAYSSSMLTPAQLADLLGVDSVQIVKERYSTKKGGTKAKLLGDYVVAAFVEPTPGMDDPSNLKRFWSPTDQGGRYAVYVEEHPKFIDVTVEHYSVLIATTTVGAKRYNIS